MENSKLEKSRIIYRCGNRHCRGTITKFKEFCKPCLQHYQIFKKDRRPRYRKKIVCSKSACFSCVWPEEIRKHPVSESWICLSCYKKEVCQLKSQAGTKTEFPETPNSASPDFEATKDHSDDSISYEIYQEALKVYEELRKTKEGLPPVLSPNEAPQNFDEIESQCSDDSFPVIQDFSFSGFDDKGSEDFINNYHDPVDISKTSVKLKQTRS